MDHVAAWSKEDRRDLFTGTANRRGLASAIIEKDFWVCWTLKHVFSLSVAPHLLFKGGTSLSKVFSAIQRFSEDIDLSIHREYLGFGGENDPELISSANRRDSKLKALQDACEANIRGEFLPLLRQSFQSVLGDESSNAWSLKLDETDPQTILFTYPSGIAVSGSDSSIHAYVAPIVKLEMGARSDPYPSGSHQVISYAAEEFPEQFEQARCTVNALEAERTFWEKATILHAEYHRPSDSRTPGRFSRHYYDLAQLATTEIGANALLNTDLLDRVATHKKIFFRAAWARYDEARPGSLRLVPPASRLDALRRDYDSMAEMFFDERPSFEYVIATLQLLEDSINFADPA